MSEKKQAPRRKIIEIRRIGAWGKVRYEHVLSCGHREIRPRASSAPQIACVTCLRTQQKEEEMMALGLPTKTPDDYDSKLFDIESEIGRLKAKISHALGISLEQIDVNTIDRGGELQITSAVVFILPTEVRKLLEP